MSFQTQDKKFTQDRKVLVSCKNRLRNLVVRRISPVQKLCSMRSFLQRCPGGGRDIPSSLCACRDDTKILVEIIKGKTNRART